MQLAIGLNADGMELSGRQMLQRYYEFHNILILNRTTIPE